MNNFNRSLVVVGLVLSGCGVTLALQRPQSDVPVKDFVLGLRVGPPSHYRNLAVYPLMGSGKNWHASVLTMDEAERSGQLAIGEIGDGEVNSLSVENTGSQPVFIMAGEILEGAKQTRVLQSDALIPPHSGRLHVSAFCVEHGRWSYQSGDKNFKTGGLVSNPAVRAEAQISRDQSGVWNKVAQTHERLQVPSSTGALTEAYRAPQVQEDIGPYVRALQSMPKENGGMVGAVVVVGGRLLCADGFGDRHLEEELWPKLIRSYSLEAVATPSAKGEEDWESRTAVQQFLQRVDDANVEKESTPGWGLLEQLNGRSVSGAALVYQSWPLHVALFPRQGETVEHRTEEVAPLQRNYGR